MARSLPPPPLLMAWPLVEDLFFAASLSPQRKFFSFGRSSKLKPEPLYTIQKHCYNKKGFSGHAEYFLHFRIKMFKWEQEPYCCIYWEMILHSLIR